MMAAETVLARLDPALVAARVPLEQIPVVDFGPFLHGSPAERKAVARKIGEACRNIGFFYLINHGVPAALTDRVFAESRRFFALPIEKKREIAIEKSPCHRGYFGMGGENLDPKRQRYAGDLKEGIKIGRDLATDHPLVKAGTPLHGPDQWPTGLPGWRETMQECYDALVRLGRELMHAFALALELPENHFDRWLNTSGKDRYSLPFFFDPDFNADLTCLSTCQGPDRPAKYPPTSGGQHLLDMINATFDYHRDKDKKA
jgi:isopenicillin N synthase-like dioxygenase